MRTYGSTQGSTTAACAQMVCRQDREPPHVHKWRRRRGREPPYVHKGRRRRGGEPPYVRIRRYGRFQAAPYVRIRRARGPATGRTYRPCSRPGRSTTRSPASRRICVLACVDRDLRYEPAAGLRGGTAPGDLGAHGYTSVPRTAIVDGTTARSHRNQRSPGWHRVRPQRPSQAPGLGAPIGAGHDQGEAPRGHRRGGAPVCSRALITICGTNARLDYTVVPHVATLAHMAAHPYRRQRSLTAPPHDRTATSDHPAGTKYVHSDPRKRQVSALLSALVTSREKHREVIGEPAHLCARVH